MDKDIRYEKYWICDYIDRLKTQKQQLEDLISSLQRAKQYSDTSQWARYDHINQRILKMHRETSLIVSVLTDYLYGSQMIGRTLEERISDINISNIF